MLGVDIAIEAVEARDRDAVSTFHIRSQETHRKKFWQANRNVSVGQGVVPR